MKDFIKSKIDINDYPNALAHLRIYPQTQSIEFLDMNTPEEDVSIMKSPKKIKKQRKQKNNKYSSKALDEMWRFMSAGKIDISYACVGYTFDEGRPILDHSTFLALLVNYGFDIKDSLDFINDFCECAKDDPKSPIIMTNIHVAKIMTEINPVIDRK